MKKSVLLFLLVFSAFQPVYAGQPLFGMNAVAFASGLDNLYAQLPLAEKSAVVIEYAQGEGYVLESFDSIESVGFSYKKYNKSVANGTFWRLGAGKYKEIENADIEEGYRIIALYGTERITSTGFFYGIEGGINTTFLGTLSLYIGYQL